MNKTAFLLAILCLSFPAFSQLLAPPFTPAVERLKNLEKRKALLEKSLVARVPFKSIGPTVFSGRVADVDVWEQDPTHFFVAYASGGLWKTENNGQSFTPLFDNEIVMTIGDIAVDWQHHVVWVGTGEVNSSRSSYAGMGMFRSDDGGKTWQHKGLGESHHIGRVILHPNDPNTLWVAALGHLYSPNQERGVYKTTDGGATWRRVLFTDGNTGAVDLVIDPLNSNVLYAAMWQRERRAWNFVESGEGSGIYKSEDGGETWSLVSDKTSGFPAGEGAGRIGLATARQNGWTYLYAIIDNQNRRPKEEKEAEKEKLTKDELRTMSKETFLALKNEKLSNFLKDNGFPEKYDADKVIEMVKTDKIKPIALAEYLEDANTNLFDTEVTGAEVYRSADGGKTWKKTHAGYLDDLYYSYGYYFGQIVVAPQNPEHLYIYGVPVLASKDGGKTWKSIDEDNVHGDHHALWINPNRGGHLILGNDGGINISYDDGENWIKCNSPAVGQFYHIAVDMEKTYNVYGGLQDNGVWYGPHTYEASSRWHGSGQYPYKFLLGGDGMQTAVDTRDNNTVFTGFQFGNYYRMDKKANKRDYITPQHDLGERPLRWNWQSPIQLSSHNQDILYMGSNKLHRSLNQGKDWETISADLTKGGQKGDVPYGTLTTLHESPLKFGLIYTGSDDGLVQVTKDGGNTWTNISAGLPENLWVSRVQASQHEQSRVFVTLNGYRWDDCRPFVFISEDYGATWQQLGASELPLEPVNVIKEDPKNPDLLYLGTDHALYLSLDRGKSFMQMNKDLPAVPIHDVVVHPRENHLLVGTHGRSIYLADVQHVQQLRDSILQKPLYAFEVEKLKYHENWGAKGYTWSEEVAEPGLELPVFSKTGGNLKISVRLNDFTFKTWETPVSKGLNYLEWHGDLDPTAIVAYEKQLLKKKKPEEKPLDMKKGKNDKYYLIKGTYSLVFEKDGAKVERKFVVE
jgi:photosystem II stability/assembly factor-like uncharacterized protein